MKIKDQLLFEFCEQKKCVIRFKKICNHCLAYHFSIFIQEQESQEPYCGAVDNIFKWRVLRMKYYITKYALTTGIRIVEIDKYDNDKDYFIIGYSYLNKNKDIFDNKEDAEKNFQEKKLKKIESLKKQLSKLEKMKIKYEKESK